MPVRRGLSRPRRPTISRLPRYVLPDGRTVALDPCRRRSAFRARSELREDVPSARRIEVRDPGDHYLVALSREAGVDYLVSVDHNLLDAELDVPVVDPAVFVAGLHHL
jgi:hypothetical protein